MANANYLEKKSLSELDEYRHKIFALREEAYRSTGIDVLDNDTLSALSIYEIVSQYDEDYNINFARNGEDAKSQEVLIEMKASRVERKKRSGLYGLAGFQFHAMGNLEYDRYIFVTRDRATLKLIKIYDISEKKNCKKIKKHLLGMRAEWVAGGMRSHDGIFLKESFLKDLEESTTKIINGVEVVMAWNLHKKIF